MVVVVSDKIIFHCCRAVPVSLGARGPLFPGSSQGAEDSRPFFSLDGFETLDHRCNFLIDGVKKRVAPLFGPKQKLLFNFRHRPGAKRVCSSGHKTSPPALPCSLIRTVNVLITLDVLSSSPRAK